MESHPKSEEKLYPNWLELPREVTLSILERLGFVDILESVQRVCTQWESISKEPSLWRIIILRNEYNPWLDLDSLFKEAVDRSCGGLIDLQLIFCNSEEYLDYVTQRCTKIRRLRLVAGNTSDYGLCEAAKKLPMLEDLEISCCEMVTAMALLTLGEFCPLLKSLKMNRFYMWSNDNDDIEAILIAENMVELRHLQLLGNRLSNKGLEAILDSCSHLESLDLRQCCNLDLKRRSLGKRCTETFKDFRDPSDSFDKFDFETTFFDQYEAICYGSNDCFNSMT